MLGRSAKVKASNSILFTEGSPEVEISRYKFRCQGHVYSKQGFSVSRDGNLIHPKSRRFFERVTDKLLRGFTCLDRFFVVFIFFAILKFRI